MNIKSVFKRNQVFYVNLFLPINLIMPVSIAFIDSATLKKCENSLALAVTNKNCKANAKSEL